MIVSEQSADDSYTPFSIHSPSVRIVTRGRARPLKPLARNLDEFNSQLRYRYGRMNRAPIDANKHSRHFGVIGVWTSPECTLIPASQPDHALWQLNATLPRAAINKIFSPAPPLSSLEGSKSRENPRNPSEDFCRGLEVKFRARLRDRMHAHFYIV